MGEVSIIKSEATARANRKCPRCGGTKIVGHGCDKAGRQRFRCVVHPAGGCGKTFNALTNTPLARMRMPEKWHGFARMMLRGETIAAIGDSDLGISRTCAWHWRHRLLKLPSFLQAERLDGIVEADETFFMRSFKGHRGWTQGTPPENRQPRYRGEKAILNGLSAEHVPVLTALDRSGARVEGVLADRSAAEVRRVLTGKIAAGAVLCTDGLKAYPGVARRAGAEHRVFKPPRKSWLNKVLNRRPRRSGALGLGRVNGHHAQLKAFINTKFRGVSTKYLDAYVGWLRFISGSDIKPGDFIEAALKPIPQ